MIKWLSEINENDFNLVGGKGFNLGKMYQYGINVPDGFVVTSTAYESYIAENKLKEKMDYILNTECSSKEKADKIQGLFKVEAVPGEVREQIILSAGKIGGHFAVRSSSSVEDLPGMSFAGQYDSFLNVKIPTLVEKVLLCWKSLWNERAIAYRARYNISTDFSHSVVIQEMVDAELSGIIFTANPLNGIRSEILINSAYGLGEAIVSGRVNPDQYIIDKRSGRLVKQDLAAKETMCRYSDEGLEYTSVDEPRKSTSSLNEQHLKNIIKETKKIEDYFGKPQDIEFAIDGKDKLYIVQSRDITTLYPIEALEQDGKLRAYLSAGTVLLGMKEPFTPLGFDTFSQMFPTIINIMTARKRPFDNSFVKYAGCRIYVDITYLLVKKFIARQFANTFADNDLPLKDVMNNLIEKHGKTFRKQKMKIKIPWGVFKYALSMLGDTKKVSKIPHEKRYEHMSKEGDEIFNQCLQQSKNLKTLREKIDFVSYSMREAFILSQRQALYATAMLNINKIKKTVNKMYGDRFNLAYLNYSLPQCVTQELTIKMNLAAKYFAMNNHQPTADHPVIKDILDKFGHRGNIELDLGTPRWAEKPDFIINQVKTFMTDKLYERNLADIAEKAELAETLIEEIFQAVKKDKGENKARNLKTGMINYRLAAGMRERPKYDIVRIMGIAREVMLGVGKEFAEEGLIADETDIFYLFKADILDMDSLREKVAENKAHYQKEQLRTSIPRIILNTGETLYSSRVIDPKSEIIQGLPLSPGIYEGPLRVVHDPKNTNLREGEIMVAESTNPAWTPLFAIARGLILEYGGPNSHGGIVAREFGIPAVVGINSTSDLFIDGQRVRINGETGVVEKL
jgi:rifampicin phosphotransferase